MKARFTTIATTLILITIGVCTLRGGSTSDPHILKGYARYIVRPEYSRFLLFFKGDVQCTGALTGNTLTVNVSDIQSAITLNGTSLQFHSGLVERAVVNRILDGKTTMTLTLKNGFKGYQIFHHDLHQAIWIDVFPDEGRATGVLQASTRIPVATFRSNANHKSKNKNPIVDIPAMVREQLASDEHSSRNIDQHTVGTTEPATVNTSVQAPQTSTAAPSMWLLLISLSLLITGIAGIIYLVKHKVSKPSSETHPAEEEQFSGTLPLFPDYVPTKAQIIEESAKQQRLEIAQEFQQDNDPVNDREELESTLAKKFQRNLGDIQFAMKLRENAREEHHVETAAKNPTSLVINSSRLATAKKLGVGAGELELVERLKRLEASHVNQEAE